MQLHISFHWSRVGVCEAWSAEKAVMAFRQHSLYDDLKEQVWLST